MKKPNEQEIEDTLDKASDIANEGESRYHNMTYEEGIRDALTWVLTGEDNPMDE